jgi:hypothetical protein
MPNINWTAKVSGATQITDGLTEAKSSVMVKINARITVARLLFITPLVGQDNVYAAKEEEAKLYLAESPSPVTLDAYPHLKNEVGVTAPDATQLSQLWLNMSYYWRQVSGGIEGARMRAYANVSSSATVADVTTAYHQLEADLSLLGI